MENIQQNIATAKHKLATHSKHIQQNTAGRQTRNNKCLFVVFIYGKQIKPMMFEVHLGKHNKKQCLF